MAKERKTTKTLTGRSRALATRPKAPAKTQATRAKALTTLAKATGVNIFFSILAKAQAARAKEKALRPKPQASRSKDQKEKRFEEYAKKSVKPMSGGKNVKESFTGFEPKTKSWIRSARRKGSKKDPTGYSIYTNRARRKGIT